MTMLKKVYWVPGMPQVLLREKNASYQKLYAAMQQIAGDMQGLGVKRIIYFSTGWISVLGQSVQTGKNLRGKHTDENWHDLPDLEYAFNVDQKFGGALNERFLQAGLPSQTIDYEGFPVDTGTIVADRLVNPKHLPVSMVACHVYSDHAATVKIAGLVRAEIEASGIPTAVVCVGGLSGRYFTDVIDLAADRISDAGDDRWNQDVLKWLEAGNHQQLTAKLADYAGATKADMGLKAYAFTQGIYGQQWPVSAKTLAYGSLYGTGAAVIQF